MLCASGQEDYTLRMWGVTARGARAKPSVPHVGPSDALAFSRDGTLTTVRGANGSLRLWDLLTRRPRGRPFRVGRL